MRYPGVWELLDLFLKHFLQHVANQRQIGYQALQAGVFVPQLAKLPHLQQANIGVTLFSDVVRCLADPNLPTHICYRLAGIALLEGKQDLLLSELGLLHRSLSFTRKDPGSTLLQF